jgi:hypothetical protein
MLFTSLWLWENAGWISKSVRWIPSRTSRIILMMLASTTAPSYAPARLVRGCGDVNCVARGLQKVGLKDRRTVEERRGEDEDERGAPL